MSSEQFYKLTLADAIAAHERKCLTTKGLVEAYFKIRLKPGWEVTKTREEVCEELGISRSGFYKSICRLADEGAIEWTSEAKTRHTFRMPVPERHSTIGHSESQIGHTTNPTGDTVNPTRHSEVPTGDTVSPTGELPRLKRAPIKESSDSPDSFHISHRLITDLSHEEREKFSKYCQERIRSLPQMPILPDRWIHSHIDELYSQFRECSAAPSSPTSEGKVPPMINPHQEWDKCVTAAAMGILKSDEVPVSKLCKKILTLMGGVYRIGQTDECQLGYLKKEFISMWKSASSQQGQEVYA